MRRNISGLLKKFGMHVADGSHTTFDVVCGMELAVDKIKYTVNHANGTAYHFCSKSCKTHFVNDAEKYIG